MMIDMILKFRNSLSVDRLPLIESMHSMDRDRVQSPLDISLDFTGYTESLRKCLGSGLNQCKQGHLDRRRAA